MSWREVRVIESPLFRTSVSVGDMKGELSTLSYYLSVADRAFSPFSTLFLSSLSPASTCFIFNWDTKIKEPHTTREENTLQWPFRINLGFWETSHLPLPLLNVNIFVSLGAKCWVRGGVGDPPILSLPVGCSNVWWNTCLGNINTPIRMSATARFTRR